MYQTPWDAAETFGEKCIAANFCIKKVKTSRINNLNFYIKKLEIEEQTESKARRMKELIKTRVGEK